MRSDTTFLLDSGSWAAGPSRINEGRGDVKSSTHPFSFLLAEKAEMRMKGTHMYRLQIYLVQSHENRYALVQILLSSYNI